MRLSTICPYLILLLPLKSTQIIIADGGTDSEPPGNAVGLATLSHRGADDNPSHYINLQILSSRDSVHLYVDSKEVLRLETQNNTKTDFRNTTNGLHLVAVNPKSGTVVLKRYFATEMFAESVGIPVVLGSLTAGEIVVLAVKFDAGLNLARSVRRLFRGAGARFIPSVGYRSYFVWAFVGGGKMLVEGITAEDVSWIPGLSASPVYVDLLIPRRPPESCWGHDEDAIRRVEFCYQFGGYGPLCHCHSPLDLNKFLSPHVNGSAHERIPVLIIASNRPQSLFKCLFKLMNAGGSVKEDIIVAIDGDYEEVKRLLELLKVRFFTRPGDSNGPTQPGLRIARHYRFSLQRALEAFPSSRFLIVLEEDILAAPDMMSFFNQTAEILASDNSLYCVNAWNDLSAMHTGGDPRRIMRQETQPSYGWMATTEFVKQTLQMWPSSSSNFDWDIWFRGPLIKSTRECIVPEISRSFHMGESGAHIRGQFTYAYITGHLVTAHERVKLLNTHKLDEQSYEEDLYELLGSDRVIFIKTTLHPCDKSFIPRNFTSRTLVIFFSMEGAIDNEGWYKLSSCLGVFNMDTRNQHRGMFTVFFYGTRILAIGYPFSDYSLFKPRFLEPVSNEKSDWDNKNLALLSITNRRRFRVPHIEGQIPFQLSFEEPKPVPV